MGYTGRHAFHTLYAERERLWLVVLVVLVVRGVSAGVS